jgi:hypothetical protein
VYVKCPSSHIYLPMCTCICTHVPTGVLSVAAPELVERAEQWRDEIKNLNRCVCMRVRVCVYVCVLVSVLVVYILCICKYTHPDLILG